MVYLRGIPKPEDLQDVVDEQGRITLPLIGRVSVQGLTTADAETIIENEYVNRGYFRKIDVNVLAQEDEYFVRGEVKKPGRYPLVRDLTLLQAITAAGGYTDFAKRSEVRVIHGEEAKAYDAEKIEAQKAKDPLVKRGDIIIVERRGFLP
jgi:polysaccharide export outer membrane protein